MQKQKYDLRQVGLMFLGAVSMCSYFCRDRNIDRVRMRDVKKARRAAEFLRQCLGNSPPPSSVLRVLVRVCQKHELDDDELDSFAIHLQEIADEEASSSAPDMENAAKLRDFCRIFGEKCHDLALDVGEDDT